jgi:hypothetical protein
MSESPEETYTILKFIDVNHKARVYLGDQLWGLIDDDSMDETDDSIFKFESILERTESGFKRLYLFTENCEVSFDLAFDEKWKRQSLSAILSEAEKRNIEIITHRTFTP